MANALQIFNHNWSTIDSLIEAVKIIEAQIEAILINNTAVEFVEVVNPLFPLSRCYYPVKKYFAFLKDTIKKEIIEINFVKR